MIDFGVLEIAGTITLISGAVGSVFGVLRWAKNGVAEAVAEETKDRCDQFNLVDHRIRNVQQRMDAAEKGRLSDVERIVRLEVGMDSLKEGQTRIEHSLETARKDAAEGRAEIIDSLRELRNVTPRP